MANRPGFIGYEEYMRRKAARQSASAEKRSGGKRQPAVTGDPSNNQRKRVDGRVGTMSGDRKAVAPETAQANALRKADYQPKQYASEKPLSRPTASVAQPGTNTAFSAPVIQTHEKSEQSELRLFNNRYEKPFEEWIDSDGRMDSGRFKAVSMDEALSMIEEASGLQKPQSTDSASLKKTDDGPKHEAQISTESTPDEIITNSEQKAEMNLPIRETTAEEESAYSHKQAVTHDKSAVKSMETDHSEEPVPTVEAAAQTIEPDHSVHQTAETIGKPDRGIVQDEESLTQSEKKTEYSLKPKQKNFFTDLMKDGKAKMSNVFARGGDKVDSVKQKKVDEKKAAEEKADTPDETIASPADNNAVTDTKPVTLPPVMRPVAMADSEELHQERLYEDSKSLLSMIDGKTALIFGGMLALFVLLIVLLFLFL